MREQSVHQYTKLVMKVSASGDTTYVQRAASDVHFRAHYGNYVKETGMPDKIYNEEGYIALHGDSVSYHFFERDYLGSVRAVFDRYGNLEQATDYNVTGIPSSRHLGNADVHKHTGKEFQGFNGLSWYDNQARYYDPILARFTTQDPLAEKYPWLSPYCHCANNPLKFVDIMGDSLILSGNITEINRALNIYSKGTGYFYRFTTDRNGVVSMQLADGKNISDMTAENIKFNNVISQIINSDKTTTLNITNGTKDIIANISTATIDIADVENLDSHINSSSILIHETYEQFLKQAQNKSDMDSHIRASGIELYIYNQAAPADERNIIFNPNGGGILEIIIRNINKDIINKLCIPFDLNNNF